MNRDRKKFRLYAVTDSRQLHGRSLPQAVEEVIKGGATMIQLREKDAKDSRLLKLAGDVLSVCSAVQQGYISDSRTAPSARSAA